MKVYVANAFSLSMLDRNGIERVPRPLSQEEAINKIRFISTIQYGLELVSVIGHADTANVISNITGVNLPVNRVSIKLKDTDVVIVAQYVGERLPEGATTLPDGAYFEWWEV